jgi:hypothetical protein
MMKLLLDAGSLPYFCLAIVQPQATLLYWAGNSIFFYGMQSALSVPKVARTLGLPNMLLPMPRGPREERGALRFGGSSCLGSHLRVVTPSDTLAGGEKCASQSSVAVAGWRPH